MYRTSRYAAVMGLLVVAAALGLFWRPAPAQVHPIGDAERQTQYDRLTAMVGALPGVSAVHREPYLLRNATLGIADVALSGPGPEAHIMPAGLKPGQYRVLKDNRWALVRVPR